MLRGRAKPSKAASALLMVVSLIFVGIGLLVVIPAEGPLGGPVGVLWTLIFAASALFHALNLFTELAVTDETITIEGGGKALEDSLPFDERMRRLERLREEDLITEQEYQSKRDDILRERW